MFRASVLTACLLATAASAQIVQPLSSTLRLPALSDFAAKGSTLTAKDGTTVTLGTRGSAPGTVYVESAAVTVPSGSTTRAGELLSALTGEDLTAPVVQYLAQPGVQAQLMRGVTANADPFDVAFSLSGKALVMKVTLQQVSGFAPVPAGRVLGDPAAPYVIRMYSDFQCPYCQQAELEAVPDVVKMLGRDVRFEFHHLPLVSLHPNARAAAEASVCAERQGKFFAFKDALFRRNDWQRTANPSAVFQQVAQASGVNVATYRSCVADRLGQAAVDDGIAEATRLGVNGTPTVFIGAYRVPNPYDASSYRALLDFVRAK
ncbi:DsbA family protein [Deinococcus aquiradiocola]|uniref:Thioredoxin domain-containing protein n=1 Tax=Deinococcus aquiradiocola TaxID=393059 RepID=A0A917P7D2_9DEIO|nr:DsbA family protein [Deinococcus aquiradiocola]GGJ64897.1 hypothetical protein GCM10008939_05970 [Deinococcus aquiradiocola]